MKRKYFLLFGSAVVAGLMVSSAVAAPGGGGGPGGGGPPGGGEEEAGNNLSVPAVFVSGVGAFPVTCGGPATLPVPGQEDPADGAFPGYWIQGEDAWQAQCVIAASASARAEWGDNLTSAPLKQRTPIRVEIGLQADPALYPLTGFGVDKLTPELLDRYATYGTNDGGGIASYPEVRAWAAGVTLTILRKSDGVPIYGPAPFSAEINSTGKVVYGYNWQKPLAGEYTIVVNVPESVTLTGADAGTFSDHQVSLDISVAQSAGRGGGGGGKPTK